MTKPMTDMMVSFDGDMLKVFRKMEKLEKEIRKLREDNERLSEEFVPIKPPNEAAGCVPCFTCGGFKLPGKPCAFCKGRLEGRVRTISKLRKVVEAVRDKMPAALSTLEREALRDLDQLSRGPDDV